MPAATKTKGHEKKSSRILVSESKRRYLNKLSKKVGNEFNSTTVADIVAFVKTREADFLEWAKTH